MAASMPTQHHNDADPGGRTMKLTAFLAGDNWHADLPMGVGVPASAGLMAWIADIPWGQVLAAVGIAISTIGPPLINFYRRWAIVRIELRERERRLREMPADRLDPDATHAAEQDAPQAAKTDG